MRPITPGAILLLALAPAGGDAQEQEERFIRIDTLNVRDTLYHLGDGGANALALIDEINGGVILVGTKLPGWGQPVLDAVYQVTDLPVTTIVSTHSDLDHTGSNAEFPDVVEIIAHENTRANMARMEPFADGLTRPNGITYHEEFIYVAGGARIYRLSESGAVTTIVDDLPAGAGFWTGGVTIGADRRLYVALGAPCDNCEFDERERGAILSMNLDGSDRRIVADGFRQPADVAFYRGQLWTLDSAPRGSEGKARDELNWVRPGGWYGFPYCLGAAEKNLASDSHDCAESISPVMLFGAGAKPINLAAYPHDTLPGAGDTLIVVLGGEPSQIDIVGYKVIMISFDEANQPLGATILMPYRHQSWQPAYVKYQPDGLFWERFIYVSEQGFGLYPQRPWRSPFIRAAGSTSA